MLKKRSGKTYAGQGFPQQGNLRFFRPFHFFKLVNLDLNLLILVLEIVNEIKKPTNRGRNGVGFFRVGPKKSSTWRGTGVAARTQWTRSSRLISKLRVVLRVGGLIPFETSPCLSMEPAATDQN